MIRLINTTTRLSVDQTLEDVFFGLIKPSYSNAVLEQRYRHHDHIDIHFVSKDDLDLDRRRLRQIELGLTETDHYEERCSEEIPDMDSLGVYFSHHPDYHRPVIKVSPEKLMAECQLLKTKTAVSLPLTDLYPTLLHAVVIHELAHSLMDSGPDHPSCYTPWDWLARELDEETRVHYLENLDHYFDSHCYCDFHRKNILPKVRQWRHVIEESLANAFVLKQDFNAEQLAALTLFIANQPPAYKAGLKWQCTLPELLETAESWRRFKSDLSRWDLIYSEADVKSTLEILADRLTKVEMGQEGGALIYLYADCLKESESVGAVDFQKDFYQYLASRLPVWQATFEKDEKKWGDFLNGTFGVLWHLAAVAKSTNQKIKFLEQQAGNLSSTGADHAEIIDKIKNILFKASMAE